MSEKRMTLEEAGYKSVMAELRLVNLQAKQAAIETEKAAFELGRMKKLAEETDSSEGRNNIFTFYSDVNEYSVAACLNRLGEYSRRDPDCSIEIVFNSPGGYVTDGLCLYDYLQQLRVQGHHITTVGVGMAASMGGVLLQAGDHRIITKNAFMLIHEIGGIVIGKMSDVADQQKFMMRLQDRCLDILAERSSLTKNQIKTRWKKTDWWVDSEECLKYGFIDEVR